MDLNTNPFADFNAQRSTNKLQIIPTYPKTVKHIVKISDEANELLNEICKKFTGYSGSQGISLLLEQLGLAALIASPPELLVDQETNLSTEDCRQSGFIDGYTGDVNRFLVMYGKLGDPFQLAYMRGYYEGHFLRTNKSRRSR